MDELSGGVVDKLDPGSAAFINTSGLAKASPMGLGLYRIEPLGKVGSVRTSTVQLEVRPKDRLGLSRLLFLLSYAGEQGFRDHSVEAVEHPDLWSALAESLAQLADRALNRGVLQGYLTVEESLRTVKGRIRISDQISRRPGMMVPLEVAYDEFTEDIAENRILRAALERMGKVPGVRPDVLSRLRQLKGKLDAVTRLQPGAPLPQWRASRMNLRYHPVLRLSEVILRNASAEAGEGKQQTASFVVDMARVFEEFVGTALRGAMSAHPGEMRLQYGALLNEAVHDSDRLTVRPDAVHFLGGRPVVVYDSKYKAASDAGASLSADHYQLLAYCTALRVPTAWLVYAGRGDVKLRRILNTDIDIVEYPLDLSLPPSEILAAVADLAEQSWGEVVRQAVAGRSASD
ncbi:5-methylcytosine-specific restriction enzyme subunit McrC [Paenarthrobacter nicotinovorans]|uniref:Restriction endonuclease n=1 Tax=Paenarthrobacter nicotinovorans TaxID=29320 RepID=A0ABV0GN02_PAENI|nr:MULTISPECIES: restriction endonuclease [Micrococcaceae]MDR6436958.1 5-methylcytosine-specific restriction enzyme subunit McrC [Paenarthrobacter nicotinovorans]BCW57755.1 McrBC 5-methylcytosine restriction system component [Arthrobacter sp. StoSoilB20]SCZ55104.1 5-methylcytosine-specific restriction enzyme subunit McrC [Arthrobacter sp. UNCCL28]